MNKEQIEYLERESIRAREDLKFKRVWILCIILAVLLAASWIGFFVYESQYDDVVISQEVEQNADNGVNHFIGGDNYGDAAG